MKLPKIKLTWNRLSYIVGINKYMYMGQLNRVIENEQEISLNTWLGNHYLYTYGNNLHVHVHVHVYPLSNVDAHVHVYVHVAAYVLHVYTSR